MQSTPTRSAPRPPCHRANRRGADRHRQVIQKIGLCICLYDILWTSEGLIGHGTGLVNVNGMPFARRRPGSGPLPRAGP